MNRARIKVYVDRRAPLAEFTARYATDPAGARRYWASGGGIEFSKPQLAAAVKSVSSIDLSNRRLRRMRELADTYAKTGHVVVSRSFIESLRVQQGEQGNPGDGESNGGEAYGMAAAAAAPIGGLAVLGGIAAVVGIIAFGIWVGDTLEDATNDDDEDEGGDTTTVNNNGNGDVEINK